HEEALASYDQALHELRRLVADGSDAPAYRRDLAITYQKRGILLRDLKRYDLSRNDLGQAVHLFEDLADRHPTVAEYRFRLSFSQSQWATTLRYLDALEEALAHFQTARVLMESLVQANPSVHAYREELAGVLNNLGN